MSNLAAQRPLPLDSSAPNDEGVVALTAPSNSLPKNLAIRRYEAALSHLGPLVVRTGQYTGRLPKDKFLMRLNFSNAAPEQIREGIRCLAAAVKSHLATRRSFPECSTSQYTLDNIYLVRYSQRVAWAVEVSDEFAEWYRELADDEHESVNFSVDLLEELGPSLGRPHVDTVRDSRHAT